MIQEERRTEETTRGDEGADAAIAVAAAAAGGRNRNRGDRPERSPAMVAERNVQPMTARHRKQCRKIPHRRRHKPRPDRPRRERGGRGRRRWRDRDDRGRRTGSAISPATAAWPSLPLPAADGNRLPAFATEDRAPPAPPHPYAANRSSTATLESTPRDPNAPTKKGWWQKMIELDD